MKTAITAAILACTAGASFGGTTTTIAEFSIHDHPQGAGIDPAYALRLDWLFGDFRATFSADVHNNATLTVVQDDMTGDFYIDIAGTFFGGEDAGEVWNNPFSLEANFRYEANVVEIANGWEVVGFSPLSQGSFTRMDTNETIDLFTMVDADGLNGPADRAFTFAADGWRIDNDDTTWVGRGWFTENNDGTPSQDNSQDWFFTATPVPAPSGLFMLGLGGLAATRRRR